MTLKSFLTISSAIGVLFGLGFLLAPESCRGSLWDAARGPYNSDRQIFWRYSPHSWIGLLVRQGYVGQRRATRASDRICNRQRDWRHHFDHGHGWGHREFNGVDLRGPLPRAASGLRVLFDGRSRGWWPHLTVGRETSGNYLSLRHSRASPLSSRSLQVVYDGTGNMATIAATVAG